MKTTQDIIAILAVSFLPVFVCVLSMLGVLWVFVTSMVGLMICLFMPSDAEKAEKESRKKK